MAYTLIINTGSSSKKYTLFAADRPVLSVRFEQRGDEVDVLEWRAGVYTTSAKMPRADYGHAVTRVIDTALLYKIINHPRDVMRVGVRIVAPGTLFQRHQLVTDEFVAAFRAAVPQAPLHIPPTLAEIEHVRLELPQAQIVAVSDSAFHATMPAVHRLYSIPAVDTTTYDIYRFGYHGLSVAAALRGLPAVAPTALTNRVVVCHIGSGASITAVQNGASLTTTMGYGPGSGLIMGTRAGDIEPGALLELARVKQLSPTLLHQYLQTSCGLRGLAGESDLRQLLDRHAAGDDGAVQALTMYANRFRAELARMVAALGGVDTIVLTGTAVERSAQLRTLLFESLEWLGVSLASAANETVQGVSGIISTPDSVAAVVVIRSDEEGEMYRVTSTVADVE